METKMETQKNLKRIEQAQKLDKEQPTEKK